MPAVTPMTALGLVMRIPLWAQAVVFTMHIRYTLERSFTEAGVAVALMSVTVALAGPWRGKILDRRGLRAALIPCLVVFGALWLVIPWLPYWWLLPAAVIAGLFYPPHVAVSRQVLIAATDPNEKKTILALDSAFMELSFVVGPAVGVWAALTFGSRTTLMVTISAAIGSLAVLAWWNPATSATKRPTASTEPDQASPSALATNTPPTNTPPAGGSTASGSTPSARTTPTMWTGHVVSLLLLCVVMSALLGATDISTIAGNEHFGSLHLAGLALGTWAVGSMISSLVYGAVRWQPSFPFMSSMLALATLPMALATNGWALLALLFLAGIPCGPAIVSSIDSLTDATDPSQHGQAMGTHSACMHVGGGLGAPLAGFILERGSWWHGMIAVAVLVLLMAGVAAVTERQTRRPTHKPTPHRASESANVSH